MINLNNTPLLHLHIRFSKVKFNNIIKRHVGEIVPKISSFSKQVMLLTGKSALFQREMGFLNTTISRTVTVLTKTTEPHYMQTTKKHRTEVIRKMQMDQQHKEKLAVCFENLIGKGKKQPEFITLTTADNVTYTTIIKESTKASDLTIEIMFEEMKKRKLIIEDKENTGATSIILQHDNTILVGLSKNQVKLTLYGIAYFEKVSQPVTTYQQTKPCPQKNDIELSIILPPMSTEDTIIDHGKQKHLLLVYNVKGDFYMVIGYFTSKKSSHQISEKQFKNFQEEQHGIYKSSTKKQYIVLFPTPLKIEESCIQQAKWGQEYLQNIPQKNLDEIYLEIKNQWPKGYGAFTNHGITKEQALQMCKDFDKDVSTKGKHLTLDNKLDKIAKMFQFYADEKQHEWLSNYYQRNAKASENAINFFNHKIKDTFVYVDNHKQNFVWIIPLGICYKYWIFENIQNSITMLDLKLTLTQTDIISHLFPHISSLFENNNGVLIQKISSYITTKGAWQHFFESDDWNEFLFKEKRTIIILGITISLIIVKILWSTP